MTLVHPGAPSTSDTQPAGTQQEEEQGGLGVEDYASAAIAGLPQDDDAVILARLAEASGKSLQDLVEFSYANGGLRRGGCGLCARSCLCAFLLAAAALRSNQLRRARCLNVLLCLLILLHVNTHTDTTQA